MQNTLDQVSKTTIELLLKEPFYGHFFSGMLKIVTPNVPSLAISLNEAYLLQLEIDPQFWETLGDDTQKKIGLIKHEVLHIALKHLIRIQVFDHETLFNIAADLVVNQYLSKEQLPHNALTLDRFSDFHLLPLQALDYYYQELLKQWTTLRQNPNKAKAPAAILLEALLKEKDQNLRKHDRWNDFYSNSLLSQMQLLERSIDANLRTTINRVGWNLIGQLPQQLQLALEPFRIKKAKVNWRIVLRGFASSSGRSRLKNTLHRRSKRYGTTPGIKIKRHKQLLVGIDTSGSINQYSLKQFFNEIHHLWKQGHQINIVEIDAKVQRQYFYKGRSPEMLQGRGGTDYNALIEWGNRSQQSDGLIYFTDGFAPQPKVNSRSPILWLISENGIEKGGPAWNALPGRKIKIA